MSSFAPLICLTAALVVFQQPGQQPVVAPAPRVVAQNSAGKQVAPPPRVARANPVNPDALPRKRHALILCGHSGDADHTKSFAETVRTLGDGLARNASIPAERQHIVFGTEQPKDLPGATGPATREAIIAAIADVKKALRPEDGLWVICLGHGHHDGRHATWNLPGPDITAAEFGKLFTDLNCREQVFVMSFSLSGYFVSHLARRDRVVIAATEADAETNETTFPTVFAGVLSAGLGSAEQDADKDDRLTLFDLYIATTKEIAQNYASAEQLATEHAQLDDDGDGVGHELQNAFLPEEQGGTPPGKKANKRPHRDGVRAAQIPLSLSK